MFSLAQAAQEVGRSKSALLKSIKSGRLSAVRDDRGAYFVDPVELFRVFSPVSAPSVPSAPDRSPEPENSAHLERTISELRSERDYLRQRLEARDRDVERLTMLLAPPQTDAHPSSGSARNWWVIGLGVVFALIAAGFALFRVGNLPY
jgi:hypothetical protein